jgi:hypothetical protein
MMRIGLFVVILTFLFGGGDDEVAKATSSASADINVAATIAEHNVLIQMGQETADPMDDVFIVESNSPDFVAFLEVTEADGGKKLLNLTLERGAGPQWFAANEIVDEMGFVLPSPTWDNPRFGTGAYAIQRIQDPEPIPGERRFEQGLLASFDLLLSPLSW